tara:strand:+ start:249172 stop:250119 length:948 start_codon:yes stop_codon:yes gene_type:complete
MATGVPVKRILVIKLGALGDVVQALGPMAAIRNHFKDAHITVLTRPPFDTLITARGLADQIIFDPKPAAVDVPGWLRLRKILRDGGFDQVFDLQTSSRSSAYLHLFWPSKPIWSGIAAGCALPHTNPNRDRMHTLERQADQLHMAGIETVPAPSLDGIDSDISNLGLPPSFTMLVPGGGGNRPKKLWSAENYHDIACRLDLGSAPAVVVGTEDERARAAEIIADAPNALNLAGKTSLLQLVGIAKAAKAALGNDSGPMHVAAVAGTPSVVLYSEDSDPALCAQRGADVTILRRPSLDALSVDDVMQALPAALGGS